MEKGLSGGCRFFCLPTLVCDILSGFNRVLLEYLNVNFLAKKIYLTEAGQKINSAG